MKTQICNIISIAFEYAEQLDPSFTACANVRRWRHFGWQLLTKVNVVFLYNSATELLDIHTIDFTMYVSCTWLFIAALF